VVKVGIALAEPMSTFDGTTPTVAPHLRPANQLTGYAMDDCIEIHANSIEHTVQFKRGCSLAPLKGKSVVLMFQLCEADLFGFRFA